MSRKLLAVMLTITMLLVLLLAPAQVSAAVQVKVSGSFYASPDTIYHDSTTVELNENISIETFTVIQQLSFVGDLQTEDGNPSILYATGTNRFNTKGRIWITQKASFDIQFTGTIAGRTGEARLVGSVILMSPDGNVGKARGQLTVTGISGELEGMQGRLTINSDTIEDNQLHFTGHITFAD